MSDVIPLYGFIDDAVFLTKSGALGLVLALEGVDYECLDPQQREAVTTRFEVALRVWDERTRLHQYVLKRNRVTRPDTAHPHPAVDALLRRRHAYVQTQQAELFTVSLYLVVIVDPRPAGDGVGEAGPSGAAPAPHGVPRVVLDRAHDRPPGRRPRSPACPAAPQGRRLRAAARGHRRPARPARRARPSPSSGAS